jgi:hypothetical protein
MLPASRIMPAILTPNGEQPAEVPGVA